MKRYLLAIILCLGFYSVYSQAKNPADEIVTGARRVYLTYQGQKDSLYFPNVSDKYPALKEALSAKNILQGEDLDTVIAHYAKCGCGTTALSYSIAFANADVISFMFYYDGMDVHPYSSVEWLTLNVHTGKPYVLDSELTPAGLDYVTTFYKKKLKQNIEADKELKVDDQVEDDVYGDLVNSLTGLNPKTMLSDYVFTNKGLLLKTDALLPKDVQDHEPERILLIPYAQLKPYVKAGASVLKGR